MAIKAITYVIDHAPKDIKPAKLLVLMMLADSAGGDDWSCYPSTRYLSEKARVDQRYGKQLLQELVTDGLIEIERFGGMKTDSGFTNRYYVLCNGRRFSETGAPQLTGGNYSAPQGVNQGSPKPSVEPSENHGATIELTDAQKAVGLLARFYETKSGKLLAGWQRRDLDSLVEDFPLSEIEAAIKSTGDRPLREPLAYLRRVLMNVKVMPAPEPAVKTAAGSFWGRDLTDGE
jgi:hypothetical protein